MIEAQADTRMIWVVDVPVATVWTSPDSLRKIDEHGFTSTVSMKKWVERLNDETKTLLSTENLVQSQLLYGEEVLVEEKKDGWAKVVIPTQISKKDERGYPGYIPADQLTSVAADEWKGHGIVVVHKKQAMILNNDYEPMMEVSYLTSLPVLHQEGDYVKVRTTEGEGYLSMNDVAVYPSKEEIPTGNGMDLIQAGEMFIDLPYFWGGMSAYGYDCSGFVYTIHKAFNYEIPRDATDQAVAGDEVPLAEIQPGDLLFFAYEEGKGSIHHVGFYYGEGQMLHSPKVGKSIEIIDLKDTVYEKELCRARRYWKGE